jgi:hypothetical protein
LSYGLFFWEKPADQPCPATPDEATQLLDALRKITQAQNPKFIELARRLTSRYVDITSPEADELSEHELAWTEGPFDGRTDQAFYGIGINTSMMTEVAPFVIEQAKALGLNVTDIHSGEVYLANGQVLSAHPGVHAQASAKEDAEPTALELERTVFDRLKPFMEARGYKGYRKTPKGRIPGFVQEFPRGWHEFTIFAQDTWPLSLQFSVRSRVHEVCNLMAEIYHPGVPLERTQNITTTAIGMGKWVDTEKTTPLLAGGGARALFYSLETRSQIDAAVKHAADNLEPQLFPALEKYKTVEGLDEVLNAVPLEASMFFHSHTLAVTNIFAAYLAGNPRAEAIGEESLAHVTADELRAPILRCLEYVRKNRRT